MNRVHTAANAVPPVDGTELGGVLEDTAGIHPGIDLIRDGIRLLATDRLTVDQTQVVLAFLIGSPDSTDIVAGIGLLVARLTNADSNPAVRSLGLAAQKAALLQGELTAHNLLDSELRDTAAEANAALDG